MAEATVKASPLEHHPAPHRHRVGLLPIWFGIAAAPIAWDVQLLANSLFVGRACYPHAQPLTVPQWPALWLTILIISLAGIAVAVAAWLVSWRSWRLTHEEKGGGEHHLLEAGQGRTRFLAMVGMMTSTLFLFALIFGTLAVFLVPLCSIP
jgi:hypothetical protein